MDENSLKQTSLPLEFPEDKKQHKIIPRAQEVKIQDGVRLIPLEITLQDASTEQDSRVEGLILPARWEDVRLEAENRHVLQVVIGKLRQVPAIHQLAKLIELSKNEGYVWIVNGKTGSGKSTFFQTLEYRFKGDVRTHIINGNTVDLTDQSKFSEYLQNKISDHRFQHGEITPLIIILEGREQSMSSNERSAISQALKNVLRAPGPGKNIVFVLPVTNINQGTLFHDEVHNTGVAVSKEGLYTFVGPAAETHAEIVNDLFSVLNDTHMEDFGISHADLQSFSSEQQSIGEYIRTIRDEIASRNKTYQSVIKNYGYRPLTVIVCFVSPEPAYDTHRVIKGMTTGPVGQISVAEILRATRGNRAKTWDNKEQALSNIIHTLDLRVVEFPPELLAKLFYDYGWPSGGYAGRKRKTIPSAVELVEKRFKDAAIKYNRPQLLKQNVRQQFAASNLFRIIVGEETRRLQGTRNAHLPEDEAPKSELDRRNRETADRAIAELACELASHYQPELHTMVAEALKDALGQHEKQYPRIANWKDVTSEAWLTYRDALGRLERPIRPDVVMETSDRLYLLEFYWRNKPMSDAEIASYVLGKVDKTYLSLPMIKALMDI